LFDPLSLPLSPGNGGEGWGEGVPSIMFAAELRCVLSASVVNPGRLERQKVHKPLHIERP